MPVFEMPLEQLRTYQGTNPRPDDFDEYWDRALEEMHGLDPELELVPHDLTAPFAECFDLYFTGVGGARVHAKYLRPKEAQAPHPAVVMFHGYSGSSGDWTDKLNYVGQGFSVAALDCRGQGGESQDTGWVTGNTLRGHIIRGLDDQPEKLLFRQIFLDTAQLAGIVIGLPEVDGGRVGASGGSQGGALALACASLEPRIVRVASVFPFLCDYRRVKLGYIDCQHLAPRIKGKLLMVTGLMDTICPPSTQFAAYNKVTSEKEMILYPDFGHEGLPDASDGIWEFMARL
jgi:cephalosporin-C deacetylase